MVTFLYFFSGLAFCVSGCWLAFLLFRAPRFMEEIGLLRMQMDLEMLQRDIRERQKARRSF